MSSPQFLSTAMNLIDEVPASAPKSDGDWSQSQPTTGTQKASLSSTPVLSRRPSEEETVVAEIDPELKLPDLVSLFIVLLGNVLSQLSFFIIVSAASAYAEHLGGTATFSGLTIGIPTVFSGLTLIPMARYDRGRYRMPLMVACAAMVAGNVLYALAYRADWLYLILIGRMVSGIGFTSFMYSKRYCSDPRIVGIRRRTTLASYLVIGQGLGFSAGPFFGGLLYRIGFPNSVFNGFTSPGWVMAICWAVFWVVAALFFQDVYDVPSPSIPMTSLSRSVSPTSRDTPSPANSPPHTPVLHEDELPVSRRQWGVIITMMWYAMTCFFILGAWESNIPVYAASKFGYSPYNSGNFIALGGIVAFPFLIINVWYSKRAQDRATLALGSSLGLSGIIIMLATIATDRVKFGSFFICWFLVALGFNLATTCTLSLLSKQLPPSWNGRISLAIQCSNYTGRVTGAIWGGAGVKLGMQNYLGLQIAIAGIGGVLHLTLWRELKAKTG